MRSMQSGNFRVLRLIVVAINISTMCLSPVFIGDVVSRLRIWVMTIHIVTATSILYTVTIMFILLLLQQDPKNILHYQVLLTNTAEW